jgi:hypothetical protein
VKGIAAGVADYWRRFMIEGLPSVLLAISIFFFLPSRPDKSRFLSEDERTVIITRLNSDSLAEGHTGIDWSGVRRALTDWKNYVISLTYRFAIGLRDREPVLMLRTAA